MGQLVTPDSTIGSATPGNALYVAANANGNLAGLTLGPVDAYSAGACLVVNAELYNGSSYDIARNNVTGVVKAAGTTATSSTNVTTFNARAITIVVNVSAYTSGTLNIAITGSTTSAYTYTLLPSITGLGATGTTAYTIGVGLPVTAGVSNNIPVPRTVTVAVSGTFSATYGIDYVLSV